MNYLYLDSARDWIDIAEIPSLIADVLHPEVPSSTPSTLRQLLKKATDRRLSDQWCGIGNNFEVSLTKDDFDWLNSGPWNALPPLQFELQEGEPCHRLIDPPDEKSWVTKYMPAVDANPPSGWILRWRRFNPHADQTVKHHATVEQHCEELQRLSIAGDIVGKRPDSRTPVHRAVGEDLRSLQLSFFDLSRYCLRLGILVRRRSDMPESDEYAVGWYAAELNADRWFRRKIVTPEQAAMLLCELNPKATSIEEARSIRTMETSPEDFVALLDAFEEGHQLDPSFRTLLQWLELARGEDLKYHGWIDRYLEHASPQRSNDKQNTVSTRGNDARTAVLALGGCEPRGVILHRTRASRRDALTPVIEQAMEKCRDPADVAEVWAHLLAMAEKKEAPLRGATEEGIQYLKDGDVQFLTRDALRKRIARKTGR